MEFLSSPSIATQDSPHTTMHATSVHMFQTQLSCRALHLPVGDMENIWPLHFDNCMLILITTTTNQMPTAIQHSFVFM